MLDNEAPSGWLARWVSSWAMVIAPVTVLSTLLFYFGYVSARSMYEYFGIDVDAVGLSTQDYIMRSPQPLLVPLVVSTLAGAALLTMDVAIVSRVTAAVTRAAEGRGAAREARLAKSVRRIRCRTRVVRAAGLLGLGAGVVLLFIYALVRDWAYYNLVTPLLFTVGAGLVAYGSRVANVVSEVLESQERQRQAQAAPKVDGPRTDLTTEDATDAAYTAPAALPDSAKWLRRFARMLVYVMIATGIFWATATIAQWSGRGLAREQARHLDDLPPVILDTQERLFLRSPGIEETLLPASEGQTFHYRYRNLRLLIVGHDRMFLVPETWSASNSTLVVPLDGSIRVQFQFQNLRP